MLDLNIHHNITEFSRDIDKIYQRQIPFATKQALNDLVFDIKTQLTKEIFNIFDDANPFTLRAIEVVKAQKTNLEAIVYISKKHDYLVKQVTGGLQQAKKSVLTVPWDRHGNTKNIFKRGTNNLIRNKLAKIFKTSKRKDKSSNLWRMFFVGKPKGHINSPEGIYERLPRNRPYNSPRRKRVNRSQKLRLVVAFEKSTFYQKKFEFYKIAEQEVSIAFPKLFAKHFERAIRTMK
ncbi:MAG: hypothetical protein KC646_10195 [Candidatus Cloacimonetes bacterium]|nr:hypothetical protein [Candidatus Cloacimonadota bacterium]